MRTTILSSLIVVSVVCIGAWAEDEPGFVSLFDGETLNGWEGDETIWRVRDGMIVGGTKEQLDYNDFLSTTERFGDFELRLEIRLVNGLGNTGVQFRSERESDSTDVTGYQADYGMTFSGHLWDENRRWRILKSPDPESVKHDSNLYRRILDREPSPDAAAFFESFDRQAWNHYTIRAEGDQITLSINEFTTVSYTEADDTIPRDGIIAFQVHAGVPFEVQFRNIRIKKLGQSK